MKGKINVKVAIELTTVKDVEDFTTIVKVVPEDVRLIGKDENGQEWNMSAKSLYCSLVIAAKLQKEREHTAHEVDWNTLWCVCDRDIYELIKDYIRISPRTEIEE